ncbi:MAG TPA: serine--tRNA ligase [Rickettsiales bacterium]|nr:serine--tRNA ligase [Rickettsiales bacterium]
MLDIKFIRNNKEAFNAAMQARGAVFDADEIILLDEKKREKQTQIEQFQALRNDFAKKIAILKKNGENFDEIMAKSKENNEKLAVVENDFTLDEQLQRILAQIPNIPDVSVPIGIDENDNIEIEKWGKLRDFDFTPKSHFEIGEGLKMLDFDQSAIISGARFSTLSSELARLERALSNFMLDVAAEFGYIEISPPNLVNAEAMYGSGQLPKFAEEAFKTNDGYWLIPTSEVSLVNLVAKKILQENELPLRLTAYTPCFRREAGSAGKDTRGMIRQHQFKKVELVSITTPETSEIEHQRMADIACEILRRLELPYRKLLLCTGDMGFGSQKTFDIEVWLPFENKYREISSCSNCGDFQARRMNSRFKREGKNLFTHTLNASALAVGRTIIAILENYQQKDGSVEIPKVLQKYCNDLQIIN